jgi:septum formation topological specificity factor MinE
MNVFANILLFREKRGKTGFSEKKRLKRGIFKEERKKRRSGMAGRIRKQIIKLIRRQFCPVHMI